MEKEFNVGDRVRTTESLMYLPANITGVIVSKQVDGRFKVQIDEEEDLYAFYYPKQLELIEPYDSKTAFLSELKGLLEKYDAKISAYSVGYDGELDLTFDVGNCEVLYSEDNPIFKGHSVHTITADNIMDYDKE